MPIFAPSVAEGAVRAIVLERAPAGGLIADLRKLGIIASNGRVDSPDAFRAVLRSFEPDVVVSDEPNPELDAPTALDIVRAVRPGVPFIIVAAHSEARLGATIRAGAEDVIFRTNLRVVAGVIEEALAVRRPFRSLTARHIDVLRLLAEGNRTRSIAESLGVSAKTIESHRGELMNRLGVHSVPALVRYAVRIGLVPSTALEVTDR